MRAPVLAAAVSIGLLLLVTVPVLGLETGLTGVRDLPDRFAAKQGFVLLEEEFGVGTVDSVEVVVEGDVRSPELRAAIVELGHRIERDGAFRPPEVSVSDDGRLATVEALVAGDSRDQRSLAAVQRLRSDVVPDVIEPTGARALVTGETAEVIDYRDLTDTWLPIVFAFVLILSFVLLTVAFRTIVLAAVAIGLNLLSVGAAYGLIVLVFLEGVGRDLLGFTEVEVIAAWLPLFLFAVLFGLSMDYTVFILSRIRERVTEGAPTRDAVAYAVSSTARLVTGAALIIIAVFVGFAAGDQVEFQQMGFGVAVSLLIDATVVRLVLLPACSLCSASARGICRGGSTGSRTSRSRGAARARAERRPRPAQSVVVGVGAVLGAIVVGFAADDRETLVEREFDGSSVRAGGPRLRRPRRRRPSPSRARHLPSSPGARRPWPARASLL